MIRKIETFEGEGAKKISAHIKWDDPSDIEYRGHGFIPIESLKQMVPFQFRIDDVSSIKEAYDKFDELFRSSAPLAKKDIEDQIRKASSKIVTPDEVNKGKVSPLQSPVIVDEEG